MKYLKYFFGIQLFLASMWCFYYLVYWAGFLLLLGASIILSPLIYAVFVKLFTEYKAGCLTFLLFFMIFGFFGFKFLQEYFAPVHNIKSSIKENVISEVPVSEFEKKLTYATSQCFFAYNKTFSKSIKYHEDQCKLINKAMNSCDSGLRKVAKIPVPTGLDKDITALLTETKSDAGNSLQNWKNFYNVYNNQCFSGKQTINEGYTKMQLISALKNMYLADIKLKKAKSMVKD